MEKGVGRGLDWAGLPVIATVARENSWGYQRIRGELLKLGVTRSKGCIADILSPNRPASLPGSADELLDRTGIIALGESRQQLESSGPSGAA